MAGVAFGGEMDAAATQLGTRWLREVPMQVHDSAGLMDDALALALRLQQPAYDCLYLALAHRVDAPLATADRRLHARCRAVDARLAKRGRLLAAA